MSISAFHDTLGSLVAEALHRRITDGEQDWYDITAGSTLGDILPGPVFACIPITYVIAAPEYAVMQRLQDLMGPDAKACLAGMHSGSDRLTVYAITRRAAPEEDHVEGYYFHETQLEASDAETLQEPKIKPEYNHPLWPSPRAARFAKALAADSYRKPARMSHVQALQYLADHAHITVDELRQMTHMQYMAKHMGPYARFELKPAYGTPFGFPSW